MRTFERYVEQPERQKTVVCPLLFSPESKHAALCAFFSLAVLSQLGDLGRAE